MASEEPRPLPGAVSDVEDGAPRERRAVGRRAVLDRHAVAVYRRLLGYLAPHWRTMAGAMVAMAVYAATNGVFPFLLEDVIERLQDVGRAADSPWRIPLLIALAFGVRSVMDFLAVYGFSWVGRSVIRDLRNELFGHYLVMPAGDLDRIPSGVLISKLTYDTEQVAEAISTSIVTLLRDGLTILVLIGVMLYLSPQLTLLVAVVGPTIGVMVRYMSRAFRRYSARIQSSMGDVTRVAEQSLHGHRIVKVFQGEAYEREQFDAINRRNFRLNVRLAATRAAGDALTQYVVALGVAAVILVAFSEWMLEDLSASLFVAFLMAMGTLLAPLKRLININAAVQRGIAAAESLFETLDARGEIDQGTERLERARGDVEYRNVSFGYGRGGRVLRRVNIRAPAGSTVALVGRSGSGKSTVASLLPRFYDPDEGEILLDGTDIRRYRLADLRRQLSFVGQDVVLFDDTIANNIAYGALGNCPREEIEHAAEAAYVSEFAAALPEGLDTPVGERGVLLSGGQRQRIAIARAILKNAPVLILDEATSALDTESERRVQSALGALMKGRTTLVIAHRLSTIENADSIVVMSDGEVVETGTHAELLARGGHYAALYRMQFAG
ncbi:MAG TPA: lipid A export permease/ATP-binding protein MsbA [Gammaproteobacteria bacterium]